MHGSGFGFLRITKASLGGLEPPTFRLTAERANRLRHRDAPGRALEAAESRRSLAARSSLRGAAGPTAARTPRPRKAREAGSALRGRRLGNPRAGRFRRRRGRRGPRPACPTPASEASAPETPRAATPGPELSGARGSCPAGPARGLPRSLFPSAPGHKRGVWVGFGRFPAGAGHAAGKGLCQS